MITNEPDYLRGVQDCRAGRVPPQDAPSDYLKGYAREVDKLPNHERTKQRALAKGRQDALSGETCHSMARRVTAWREPAACGTSITGSDTTRKQLTPARKTCKLFSPPPSAGRAREANASSRTDVSVGVLPNNRAQE